jgi:hypothetical protein
MAQDPRRICRKCKLDAGEHEGDESCGDGEAVGLLIPRYSDKARKRRIVSIDRQDFSRDWAEIIERMRGGNLLPWPELALRMDTVKTAFTVKSGGADYIILITKRAEISIRYRTVTFKFSLEKK